MSDNIIDINSKLNGPDTEHVCTDANGVKWYKFICGYDLETPFSFIIWATSLENADHRMNAIRENGCVQGQLLSEVPQ